jgi:hypothetical protein
VVVVVVVVEVAAAVVTSDLHQELPKFPVVSLLLRKLFCASKNKILFHSIPRWPFSCTKLEKWSTLHFKR